MFYKIGLISMLLSGYLQAEISFNKEYKVTELYGKSTINENLTLKLIDNNKLSAFDGCNRIIGSYSKEAEQLVVNKGMMSTRRFCEDAIHSQNFNLSLEKIRTFKTNENKVDLFDENNKKILELTETE